jgi:chaperonin cofactor prefoldin
MLKSPVASKEELKLAKDILEKQLRDLAKEERKTGLQFDELKAQLKERIKEVNRRL